MAPVSSFANGYTRAAPYERTRATDAQYRSGTYAEVGAHFERNTFDGRGSARHIGGSPIRHEVRSSSPIREYRRVSPHLSHTRVETRVVEHVPAPVIHRVVPTFSHYEAHREAREEREYHEY